MNGRPGSYWRADTPPSPSRAVGLWARVFNGVYSTGQPHASHQLDLRGWVDPITAMPYSKVEMADWLGATVERVRSLAPRRVLEIGSGTGNLAVAVAAHVERYVCIDIAKNAIRQVRQRAAQAGLHNVTAVVLEASDIDRLGESFDTVVLNSVCQYFPDEAYARRVLSLAIGLIDDGGSIFVGDVRNRCLRCIEYGMIEAALSGVDNGSAYNHVRVVDRDEELAFVPSFFHDIAASFDLTAVPLLKPGNHCNALTLFRYDVILSRPDVTTGPLAQPTAWNRTSLDALADLRDSTLPLWLTGIPNRRIITELERRGLRHLLPVERQLGEGELDDGVDPGWWTQAAARLGSRVYVIWDGDRRDGYYSVIVDPAGVDQRFDPRRTVRGSIMAARQSERRDMTVPIGLDDGAS